MKLYSVPGYLRSRTWDCDYCGSACYQELHSIEFGVGILVCQDHVAWGQRDIRASYHRAGIVLVEDIPEVEGLNAKFIRRRRGTWFCDDKPLTSLPEALIQKLDTGFYKTEEMAFQVAVEEEALRRLAVKEEEAYAAKGRALMAAQAAAVARKEAVGRTRLGESKEDMLRRLTGVQGYVAAFVSGADIVTNVDTSDASADGEWINV